jgi:hypothetical protein
MRTIVVDAGHGGSDVGATSNGYIEKILNLETSKYLKEELIKFGFKVIMTREDDRYLSLLHRGQVAKNNRADMFISMHFNAFNKSARGFEVVYSYNSKSSLDVANVIFKNVTSDTKIPPRRVFTRKSTHGELNFYGVLRHSFPITAVIVEGLFIDNLEDISFLNKPNFLKDLAKSCAKSIAEYYGVDTEGEGFMTNIEPYIGKKIIIASALNIRSSPNTTGEILGQLKNGDIIEVTGKINNWLRLTYNNRDVFVHGDFTKDYTEDIKCEDCDKLKKENEELKNNINKVINILSI